MKKGIEQSMKTLTC